MRVVLTGAAGFLGWHTGLRLASRTAHDIVPVDEAEWSRLDELVRDADAVIHLAGVNRAADDEIVSGNVRLAEDLAAAVRSSGRAPALVYANSIQSGNGTPYGIGKERAGEVLRAVAQEVGGPFVDVVLPNLFGEHGRPDYNSFVATFTHRVVEGRAPEVQDRPVELLHVGGAADAIVGSLDGVSATIRPRGRDTTVASVLETLTRQFGAYRSGELPVLSSGLDVELFNTLRAAMFPKYCPIPLEWRTDARGGLLEVVRAQGSEGQTFVSTTRPGVTRGQHLHLRKVERFVVVDGTARIALRRALTDQVVTFDVTGEQAVAIDMPTGWYHNITNTGAGTLTTVFWANELFDPDDADTYPGAV